MKTKSKLSLLICVLCTAIPILIMGCSEDETESLAATEMVGANLVMGPLEEERSAGYACCPDETGVGCFDLGFTPVPNADGTVDDPCPWGWILYECDDFVSLPDGSVQCL
jgi:hypothetical protein